MWEKIYIICTQIPWCLHNIVQFRVRKMSVTGVSTLVKEGKKYNGNLLEKSIHIFLFLCIYSFSYKPGLTLELLLNYLNELISINTDSFASWLRALGIYLSETLTIMKKEKKKNHDCRENCILSINRQIYYTYVLQQPCTYREICTEPIK